MTKIETIILLYRYTFYALLKGVIGERVIIMLLTDPDLFFLHLFVKDWQKR